MRCIFPLFPVGFCEVADNLFAEWSKVMLENIPHIFGIHGVISMNNVVSHSLYLLPTRFRMRILERLGEHVGGFADNDDMIDHTAEQHLVGTQIFISDAFCVLQNGVDGLQHVEQSSFIFNWLSHKSIFCHVPHFQRPMGKGLFLRPNQHDGQANPPNRRSCRQS